MQHIDEATSGLSHKILEDVKQAELDEAGRLSRLASRVGNSILSPFSATARGKAKQAKAVSFLMGKFKEFAHGRPWTNELIHQFLSNTFSPQYANAVIKPPNTPPPPPPAPPPPPVPPGSGSPPVENATANTTNTNTNGANTSQVSSVPAPAPAPGTPAASASATPSQIPGTPENKAQTLMKQPTVATAMPKPAGQNANRGQILAQIAQQAEAKKTNPKQIMLLINQLMQTGAAKGKNSPEYAAMLKDVAALKSSLGDIVPDIKTIPTPESFLPKRRKIR